MSPKKRTDRKKKTSNLSIGLIERLRMDILSEQLLPGDKLTEKDICDQYSVSRTPVREALKSLETEGLIELIPNRGAFVIGFSIGDMKDLLELRKIYEIQAIKWAVVRIYDEELEQLEKCFEYMNFYTRQKDIKKLTEINSNFHKIIYESTHNRTLTNVLNLYSYYVKYSNITNDAEEVTLEEIFNEHAKIFNAFMVRDPECGAEAMSEHIDNATERYLSL